MGVLHLMSIKLKTWRKQIQQFKIQKVEMDTLCYMLLLEKESIEVLTTHGKKKILQCLTGKLKFESFPVKVKNK